MEIGHLNTKRGATEGAFLHLRHPAMKHLLYSGEGADDFGRLVDRDKAIKAGCVVFGAEAEYVQDQVARIQKARDKGDEHAAKERALKFVCSLVKEFVGLTINGQPLGNSEKEKREFFQQSDNLIVQVTDFAKDEANFFSEPGSD